MFKPEDLFDLAQTEHAAILPIANSRGTRSRKLKATSRSSLDKIRPDDFRREHRRKSFHRRRHRRRTRRDDQKGRPSIGKNCQIRHNALHPRERIIGDGCVVCNSSELKNSLLFTARRCRTQLHRRLIPRHRRTFARREDFPTSN